MNSFLRYLGWAIKEVIGFILFIALMMLICRGVPKPITDWWDGTKNQVASMTKE